MARRFPTEKNEENDAIDRLYQLPLNDFTRERNALAKEAVGEEGARIKALAKPSASAWAVNQLYWRDRPTYDALIAASERLRAAHRAVLGGRKADLRATDSAHREVVNAAIASTLRLATESGQTVSSSMQMEITRTLQTLPADEPPGRLAKPLSPGGFEALQGMPIRARKAEPEAKTEPETKPMRASVPDKRAAARQRKEAQRALKEARLNERRDKATVARLQRQIADAERRTADARNALDRTQATEARLRDELRQAQDALQRSAQELQARS